MTMKQNWKKYALEFFSIFFAVILAFALNNWNDNRKDDEAASKILTEILNGLKKDRNDVEINMGGHQNGLHVCAFWRGIATHEITNLDTLEAYELGDNYLALTRDFTSIQNTSGYETLKSRGFELIENDELRAEIISLYELDYQTLRKLEEEYHENQFQENYFNEINQLVSSYLVFDQHGNISTLTLPLDLTEQERLLFLTYLWKIEVNRRFILKYYKTVLTKIADLETAIEAELAN